MAGKNTATKNADWQGTDLDRSIENGELYPLYYLYGDETFWLEESLKELERVALGDGLRDFNLNSYYGDDAGPDVLRDALETLPMMAKSRVVILKEAQTLKDKEWEELMPYLERPLESTIFICVASKIDKRKKFIKRFAEFGAIVEFKRLYANQVPAWIQKLARRKELELGADVQELLLQMAGTNLSDLNQELEKLAQFLGERKRVSAQDVMEVVSRTKMDSVFELTDAIGSNDRGKALVSLAHLLDQGQSEVGIVAMISRHLRILKQIKDGVAEGLSGARLGARAGVSPFFVKAYLSQTQFWSDRKLERTFQALLTADRALKSSPLAAPIWLENLILQICSEKPAGLDSASADR